MLINNTKNYYNLGALSTKGNFIVLDKVTEKNNVKSAFIDYNDNIWKCEDGKGVKHPTRYGGGLGCRRKGDKMQFYAYTITGDCPAGTVTFEAGLKWDIYPCILDGKTLVMLMVANTNCNQSTPSPAQVEGVTIPSYYLNHGFYSHTFGTFLFAKKCYVVLYRMSKSLERDIIGGDVSRLVNDNVFPMSITNTDNQLDSEPYYFKVKKNYPEFLEWFRYPQDILDDWQNRTYSPLVMNMDADFWKSENTAYIVTNQYQYIYIHNKPNQFISVGYYDIPESDDEEAIALKREVKRYENTDARHATVYMYQSSSTMDFLGQGGLLLCFNENVESDLIEGDDVQPEVNYDYLIMEEIPKNGYCVAPVKDKDFWDKYTVQIPYSVYVEHGAPRQLIGSKLWTFWRLTQESSDWTFNGFVQTTIKYTGDVIIDSTSDKWNDDFSEIFKLDNENYITMDFIKETKTLEARVTSKGETGETFTLSTDIFFRHVEVERPENDIKDPNYRNPIVFPYINNAYFDSSIGVVNWQRNIGVAGIGVITEIPLDQYTHDINLATIYNWSYIEYIDTSLPEGINKEPPQLANFFDYVATTYDVQIDDETTRTYNYLFNLNRHDTTDSTYRHHRCLLYVIPFYLDNMTKEDTENFTQLMDKEKTADTSESRVSYEPKGDGSITDEPIGKDDPDFIPDDGSGEIDDGKEDNKHNDNPSLPDGEVAKPSTEQATGDVSSDEIDLPKQPDIQVFEGGLIRLFQMSIEQLNKMSQFLFSSDWITNFTKAMYANPLDVVISLAYTFVSANDVTSIREIKLHGLNSKTSGNLVNSTIRELSCGSLEVERTFASYLDYQCKIEIYLPFIGAKTLDTNLVMGSKLHVDYAIDLLSGSCVAFLRVEKNNINTLAYTFTGNCFSILPISNTDYTHVLQTLIATGVSSTFGFLMGGPMNAAITGGITLAGSLPLSSNIRSSGDILSNFGAMSPKVPYLIITRPTPAKAEKYNSLEGVPSEMSITLGKITGFCICKTVKIENIPATISELEMIENHLKRGVYL